MIRRKDDVFMEEYNKFITIFPNSCGNKEWRRDTAYVHILYIHSHEGVRSIVIIFKSGLILKSYFVF